MMVPRVDPQTTPPPLIPEFYAGKEVLITGATGLLGKALVERLLWTCRDVSKLYVLLRCKKGVSPEDRLKQLKQSQIFDVIRQHCPKQLEKISVLAGDITKNKLGMNREALQRINEVSVIFHSAATVKFDEVLDLAVEQNLRSVIKMMDVCDQLPTLQVLVYVSTAYSNADVYNIEERVYPPPMSLHQLQVIVDNLPRHMLRNITPGLISPKPNTYTFSKAMAESVVAERAPTAKYATAIFRPSIVASSVQHPFPGWIENLNGPSGAIASAGKGLLHVAYIKRSKRTDMIPVDIAIDTLIAVAWETAVEDARETRVYNCCSYENPTTWGDFNDRMTRGVREHPFDKPFWYPFGYCTENRYILKLVQWSTEVAPLHAANFIFKIFGIKTRPSLTTISDRIQAMSDALTYFMSHEWAFSTGNVRRLRERLAPADSATFNLDVSTIDWDDHCVKFVKGVRRFILHEKEENVDKAHSRLRLLYVVHRSVQCAIAFVLYRVGSYTASCIF